MFVLWDDDDLIAEFPDPNIAIYNWGNITIAEEPVVEETSEYILFETPNYCFGKDIYINVSVSINITIDVVEDVVCELEGHWFGAPTYRVTVTFEEEVTDCDLFFTIEYLEKAKTLTKGAMAFVWLDGTEYQFVEDTVGLSHDESTYTYSVGADTVVDELTIIVNPSWSDKWSGWWTDNL